MQDSSKTNQELIAEIYVLKKRIREMENSEAERKRKEERLRKSEEKYRLIAENTADLISILDMNLRFTYISPASMRLRGFTVEEAMELTLEQVLTPESMRLGLTVFKEEMQLEASGTADPDRMRILELEEYKKDGSIIWVEVSLSFLRDKDRKPVEVLMVSRDITARKRAEEALRESETHYRSLVEGMPGIVYSFSHKRGGVYYSSHVTNLLGYSPEQLYAQPLLWHNSIHPDDLLRIEQVIRETAAGKPFHVEYRIRDAHGNWHWFDDRSLRYQMDGTDTVIEGLALDITERNRVDEKLRRNEEILRLFIEHSPAAIAMFDREMKYIAASRRFLLDYGLGEQSLIGRSHYDVFPELPDRWKEIHRRCLAGSIEKANEDPFMRADGRLDWVHWEIRPWSESGGETCGIILFSEVITERKHAEEQLQHTLDSLRKAVNTTMQVMVSAVEVRDPYTAGHQIRSAGLACAIATEMGLPQEKIDATWMAGSVHDIGKLSIPAEILSKPTKVSEIEFSLIKEHAKKGYEMLKDVESPWPLAEIVHQHHERMDGSGYPRNLKGEEILMEARILNVADVVEAMASHRPYRPGLGIDAALNEIEKKRGIFYDNAVADACLRLFREKGFKLEGT